jgi:flavorubredoxin
MDALLITFAVTTCAVATLLFMTTRIDPIADGIYRIHTPVSEMPGGFSFNQYLVVDDEPLLFHTGGRRLFPAVREAIARVIPIDRLRWIGFSHFEPDECGALPQFLEVCPNAQPVCSQVGAQVCIGDYVDRTPRALADGETLITGKKRFTWIDTPHLPHGWDCGYLSESTTRTLFCGDLFTQPGANTPALTTGDILGPSESFRKAMDYFSHTLNARTLLAKVASTEPRTLACMHGSAFEGDGAALLGALSDAIAPAR